jgi:hypothetical protein
VATTSKSDLTFTATDPANRVLLQATDDLKGFVANAISRSQVPNLGVVLSAASIISMLWYLFCTAIAPSCTDLHRNEKSQLKSQA